MSNLPADLPENWTQGQIISPNGTEVGLTTQHGYNYLMAQVNAAQMAINNIVESLGEVAQETSVQDILSLIGTTTDEGATDSTGTLMGKANKQIDLIGKVSNIWGNYPRQLEKLSFNQNMAAGEDSYVEFNFSKGKKQVEAIYFGMADVQILDTTIEIDGISYNWGTRNKVIIPSNNFAALVFSYNWLNENQSIRVELSAAANTSGINTYYPNYIEEVITANVSNTIRVILHCKNTASNSLNFNFQSLLLYK